MISAVIAGCSANALIDDNSSNFSANNAAVAHSEAEVKKDYTEKITLTTSYNSEDKKLDYTITNGTDDIFISFGSSAHKIYLIENGRETNVTPAYLDYCTGLNLYPQTFADKYRNDEMTLNSSVSLSCLTYKGVITNEENIEDLPYDLKDTALPSGEYKLAVDVDVYNYDCMGEINHDGKIIGAVPNDDPLKTITLESNFTIS